MNSKLYPLTDLAQFHDTVFGIFSYPALLQLHVFFPNFFSLSVTEETLLVKMRIWCIKIGIVFVLHGTKS
jgi:hypothetical protein